MPGADLLLGLRGQRCVDEVQQLVVLPHADGERSDHDGKRHDQPGSQFVQMLQLLEKECAVRNINTHVLTGQTKDRQEVVNAFQSDARAGVFLLSLRAAGTGLFGLQRAGGGAVVPVYRAFLALAQAFV